jgi:Fe2+ or Zn2+ uptake regulation protein
MSHHETHIRREHREAAARAIRATGRRVTAQRVLILDALQDLGGHHTVDAIHLRSHELDPSADMALSTVYRTLDALTEIGLVTVFDDGTGSARYEWVGDDDPHHHLVCVSCGRREEIVLEALKQVEREVQERHGFSASIRHLAIRGQCEECRRNGEADE